MSRLLGLLWSLFRIAFRLKVIVWSVAAGMAIAFGLQAREQSRTWGLLPGDAELDLPGDDLVAKPTRVETRGLVIDAAAAEVWPWLVQMGYGRGGWYAFAPLDRTFGPMGKHPLRSADEVMPEHQGLSVGDIVPIQPGGGPVARIVDRDRALVLYFDDTLAREQMEAQAAEGSEQAAEALRKDVPQFHMSWAFVLEPEAGGQTRLVERVRLHIDLSTSQRRGLPIMGLALFALMRSQMLGVKRRVEREAPKAAG
jgi:hypothetical protein